jgi:uncharacterized membrane protein
MRERRRSAWSGIGAQGATRFEMRGRARIPRRQPHADEKAQRALIVRSRARAGGEDLLSRRRSHERRLGVDMAMVIAWLREFGADLFAATLSAAIVVAYYARHRARSRITPTYSIHYVNELARRAWVESVMKNPGKDVMAVQTLRNVIMVGVLMVSTTTLLIMGTLTLSGQIDSISRSWHAVSFVGSHAPSLWIIKVMCLLADFLVVFFSYAMAIRLVNHVLFMVNVPKEFQDVHDVLSPTHVADRLIRAGRIMAIGMRSLFFAIPFVFWLFGPLFLMVATIGVVLILSRLDRHQDGL